MTHDAVPRIARLRLKNTGLWLSEGAACEAVQAGFLGQCAITAIDRGLSGLIRRCRCSHDELQRPGLSGWTYILPSLFDPWILLQATSMLQHFILV